jgi:AcrR family transcriptional regulator
MPTDTFHNLPTKKRDRILEAAITEFAAHPYDAASLSNIARQAEIGKGSLYQYFENKKDLY